MTGKPLGDLSPSQLIDLYSRGAQAVREAIAGMSPAQLDATPIPGKWSTRQIICHLADCEPLYADRIKRVIAEDKPAFAAVDPDTFAAKLAYPQRDLEEEIQVISAVRAHMVRILRTLPQSAFARTGIHSADGPLTLQELLRRITNHIPHHAIFIAEKRQALGA